MTDVRPPTLTRAIALLESWEQRWQDAATHGLIGEIGALVHDLHELSHGACGRQEAQIREKKADVLLKEIGVLLADLEHRAQQPVVARC